MKPNINSYLEKVIRSRAIECESKHDAVKSCNHNFENFGKKNWRTENVFHWREKNDANLRWQVNSLSFISDYLALLTVDPELDFHPIENVLFQWSTYETEFGAEDHMLWNDHAAANRLEQFVVIDWLCSYHKKTLDNFDLFAEIRRHIEFNIDLATFSTGTNHGLFQSIAVFKAVLWLYEDEKSISDELQSAMNRMVNELNMQFGVDSVQVENSPQYHFAISSVALSCLGLMKLVPDMMKLLQ